MSDDVLTKREQHDDQFEVAPFSDAADRLTYVIAAQALPWIDCYGETGRHDQHLEQGGCAICRAGHAPHALRVVIDAVLDAAANDPEIVAAIAARVAANSFDPSLVGCAVVRCPGCGQERWYGYGACGQCGTFLPGAEHGQ